MNTAKLTRLEHKHKALLPRKIFLRRLLLYFVYSMAILGFSLLFGILGYHFIGKLSWIDSLLNASMILTGMGPVDKMVDSDAKIFSSVYALYSGIAFLSTIAIFFAPIVHRFLHSLHIDEKEMDD
ncbi:MAG TPA: hypothetical protein PKD91_05105 [Bacteroidia bacterium]|nr:hypothetical protein [Bacteroidia bacterium]